MNPAIDQLDAEIAGLQAEIARVEHMPATVAERYAAAEAELREGERIFRTHGPNPSAAYPGQTADLQRRAAIGAAMVVGAEQLLRVERQRIEAQGEGLSAADKARKLEQLRGAILKAAAKRELTLRAIEGAEFLPRPGPHPELAVWKLAAVERLAAR
jgi:hypothetical protein